MLKLFRSLVLVIVLAALYVVPASAQTTKPVKFFMWLDAPANGLFDYWTGDYCLGGDTLTVYKLGTGLQPWFYMYATHADTSVTGPNNSLLNECRNNSSATYNMVPGDYKIVGGNPSYTTYFTVASYGNGQIVGHKVPSWSGE